MEGDYRSRGADGSAVFVKFSLVPKQNEEKTKAEGRPVFDDVEYIEIRNPGDNTNVPHRPVRDHDRQRFQFQYQAWKAGQAEALSGTPLSQWPQVSRAQVEELAFSHVRTVEQLADISDSVAQRLGMGVLALRSRAKEYLERSKDEAAAIRLASELEKRDAMLEAMARKLEALEAKQTNRKQ